MRFPGTVRSIMVKAKSTEDLDRAETQIKELLRQRHRLGPGQEDDFTVRNLTQMMQMAEQASNVMALLTGGHRRRIAPGRRHRYHEYHAGFSHGKNP